MKGIINDPNASCEMSVKDTVNWLRGVMAKKQLGKVIVSREWAQRLELEGFDMSLVEITHPLHNYLLREKKKEPQPTKSKAKGPRNRWGGVK